MIDDRLNRYDPVWRASAKYRRTPENDVHILISFDLPQARLTHCPMLAPTCARWR